VLGRCVQRCLVGGGVELAGATPALPANSRFGVIYTSPEPLGAYGFGNGNTDRLAVNMAAVRACQAMAGRTACVFQREIVNSCAALAQAISRNPYAIAITDDLSTFVVNRLGIGLGPTQPAAEAAALAECHPAERPGTSCRIVAAGC
jgi:hypothetical protein